jgi:hypothetical protein
MTPHAALSAYIVMCLANGLFTGASLNYGLTHALHLARPQSQVIVVSLIGTFRGFAGSFGSAIGGGIFTRALREELELGFAAKGLTGREELIHHLIGSPALVNTLTGDEHDVAQYSYSAALRALYIAAGCFAFLITFVQAGTGWTAPMPSEDEETTS